MEHKEELETMLDLLFDSMKRHTPPTSRDEERCLNKIVHRYHIYNAEYMLQYNHFYTPKDL
jgi:hypothetical protein